MVDMITWFEKNVGNLHQSIEDESMFMVGHVIPDRVRLPPELGRKQVAVVGSFMGRCPMCKEGVVQHLKLENGLGCAECSTHGFVWYGRRSV